MQNNIRRRGNCYLLYSRRGSKAGQDYIECSVEHRKEKSISHSVARTKLVPNLIQLGCSNSIRAFKNYPQVQIVKSKVKISLKVLNVFFLFTNIESS